MSSSDSVPVEVAAPPPAAQESCSTEQFVKRATADDERVYQRRSSWELADDYHKNLWLRQAGGDQQLADRMRAEDEERIRRIVQG
jgi:hypothetical protein